MEHILLVIQLLLAIALIGAVLLQRSDSDGFGLGSGGGNNFLSGRSSANLMTRTTAILAALFIINSLILSIVASHHGKQSIVDEVTKQDAAKTSEPTKPADDAKAAPAVPQVPIANPTPVAETPEAEPNAEAQKPAEAKPADKVEKPKKLKKTAEQSADETVIDSETQE